MRLTFVAGALARSAPKASPDGPNMLPRFVIEEEATVGSGFRPAARIDARRMAAVSFFLAAGGVE